MAERSFVQEVKKLRAGAGEVFNGEGILAVTKALLESGVAYVGGYQGSPISHLMDVLSDAQDILGEYGIRFENSASEATAAAMLAASVNYPLRGAITFKATVGTNVASDALANLASGGVTGGALIIVGEDYGEGSSIMQERSHAFAMKSQMWLLDPRPNLPSIVQAVKDGFDLSEASNTPVMLQMRIRSCHLHGQFLTSDNRPPAFTVKDAMESPARDIDRIVLPPASFRHEREKIQLRWPAAIRFIKERQLNEFFSEDGADVGIALQGGNYNTLIRALQKLGLSDVYGVSKIPLYVMNVAYPLVDEEYKRFCKGKRAILILEEGQPNFVEQNVSAILRQLGLDIALHGKDMLPLTGDYNTATILGGVRAFLERYGIVEPKAPVVDPLSLGIPIVMLPVEASAGPSLDQIVHPRPPGLCTGCPERPIFTAIKLVERELGKHHISADIGCHLFSILPPFNLGSTTMGYGLGAASAAAFNVAPGNAPSSKRAISLMGDGGFWHNGLTSGIANGVFNRSDNLTIIIDNNYASATGGQDLLSSRAVNASRSTGHEIERAVKGVGVEWVRTIKRTYDLKAMVSTLREALTTQETGPKVLIAQSECMLNLQRREKKVVRKAIADGKRVVRERFGIDPDTCTGDHSCIRLSGCPSLSIRDNPDPLRLDPVAMVMDSCVGCGNCGEVAHAAVLCPSFYRAQIVSNPTRWDIFSQRLRSAVIGWLQSADARRRSRYAF
ncbi:indolepyruvate ferredoxin oxidoreductase subunit alpha [Pseudomonas trivialis]|uniref:Indolepyruvate ferredoxin oxidoreductase n=1 Tax=Pseudomonas salomonii TaxID=191391 RepID=A0ABS9GJC6_9PSED|nr:MULTISPECIES: indolepyruvate ferredoxin oxidoreductase subunit alpha [Pseudomonas]AVJ38247.1 indolepyruvate ferredoxin oxidoreductase [Pseudomonas lurida]MBC3239481.1 indolepyruvate ferredoxin oxidoreductase subunit alpha [Pseudomonas lurida]MCF5544266.1 indolepyruvate ferredoxin oxidoreductase [Pseudomonas salomonii]PRA17851.1 indolepyruvate ferredoxin oxidoreductase [Pseudomonas sp. MYb13]PRA20986.1 indolepyruvate ferredoxin oxidoreductase [Pseudomonas lurida]